MFSKFRRRFEGRILPAQRRARRDSITSDLILEFEPSCTRGFGFLALFAPLALSVLAVVIGATRRGLPMFGIGLFYLLSCGVLWLWCYRWRTRVGDDGVTSAFMFSRSQYVPWNDVTKVIRLNSNELWLHGKSGKHARIQLGQVGALEALEFFRAKPPAHVTKDCDSELQWFAAAASKHTLSPNLSKKKDE